MATSDMIVFNQQTQVVATETVAQYLNTFNQASGGALLLGSQSTLGDYVEEASYKAISALVSRRDAYGSGALATKALQQLKDVAVKVDQSIGPVEWTIEQFARLLKNEEEAGLIIGEQAAEAMIQDYLNTAAASLVAAIGNQASLVNDYSATGTAKLVELNTAAGKFGDRQMSLAAWLMHSKVFTDLTNEAITNTSQLYNVGNIRVMQDGLGRRYVVTDAPALLTAGAPDKYNTVGLVPGAAMVETQPLLTMTQPKADQENMGTVWKGESSFTIGLKGYAWDTTNGGKSPTDAELATGSNWDLIASDTKDTAGVMLISQ
jgi:hypothetical protein